MRSTADDQSLVKGLEHCESVDVVQALQQSPAGPHCKSCVRPLKEGFVARLSPS